MDKWFLKDGQICFKDENAELNNWDLKSVVSCLNTRDNKIVDLEAKLADSEKVIEAFEMKEQYLKKYYNFTDEQCKMHDLLTQLWHLTYLPNKHFAEVLRSILKEVENVKNV